MAKSAGYSREYRRQRIANGRRPLGSRGVSVSQLREGDVLYTSPTGAGNRITSINRAGNFTFSGGFLGGALRRDVDGGGWYVRRRNGVLYPVRQTPFFNT